MKSRFPLFENPLSFQTKFQENGKQYGFVACWGHYIFEKSLQIRKIFELWTSFHSVPGPNCLAETKGLLYTGNKSVSKNGNTCQAWWIHFSDNDQFPDATVEDAQNFCRNVDGQYPRPGCRTSNGIEDCDIPLCSDIMPAQSTLGALTNNDSTTTAQTTLRHPTDNDNCKFQSQWRYPEIYG